MLGPLPAQPLMIEFHAIPPRLGSHACRDFGPPGEERLPWEQSLDLSKGCVFDQTHHGPALVMGRFAHLTPKRGLKSLAIEGRVPEPWIPPRHGLYLPQAPQDGNQENLCGTAYHESHGSPDGLLYGLYTAAAQRGMIRVLTHVHLPMPAAFAFDRTNLTCWGDNYFVEDVPRLCFDKLPVDS